LLDAETLRKAVGDVTGRPLDFTALERITASVESSYRAHGLLFTRAVLPPQNLSGGVLKVEVVEGVYGRLDASGEDPLAAGAQPFLGSRMQRGDAITAAPLERTMLLLNDQPGFRVQPVLRPGEQRGEGDLMVDVQRRNRWSADLGLDNAGSRATGEYRARAAVAWNSPWRFGDRATLTALVTDKGMWLGSADYEGPVGSDGWRAGGSIARTSYQLDGEFGALDAKGTADVTALRASHAVVRSQAGNLAASLTLQHKALHDDFGDGALTRDKSSDQAIMGAQFDLRDTLAGGGITYGAASLSLGRLRLDADARSADAVTARSAGRFVKWNLDVSRIQRLPGPFSGYARLSVQGANKNLDASEKLALGGHLGVRAFPLGEASGDTGWLGQLELRLTEGKFTWFGFHDQGQVRVNRKPWSTDSAEHRRIGGPGLGVRWLHGDWSTEATVAQRIQGGPPTVDSSDRRPRLFVVLSRHLESL
jgi:hemolysin activation/secretion protein